MARADAYVADTYGANVFAVSEPGALVTRASVVTHHLRSERQRLV